MTTINTRRRELLTYLALFCLLISLTITFLWIRAFNIGNTPLERIDIFLNYFPFVGVDSITILDILCCVASIVLSSICLNQNRIGWRIFNISIIVVSALKLLLILWGML